MEKNVFNEMFAIDVNDKVEKKNGLNYLSWAWSWAEFKKRCPNAKYEIKMFNGLPYVYDEKTGYMVFTSVTVDDITHDMWLPVMDNNNKSMKDKPYTYKTSYGEKTVAAATMFDINKTIMRCLVKNLAMFGLGLYIYAGEDLPEQEQKEAKPMPKQEKPKTENVDNVEFATTEQIEMLKALGYKGAKKPETMTTKEADYYIQMGRVMKKGVKK